MFDDERMTFSYYGTDSVTINVDGDDATYLPKVLFKFGEFLRAAGFVYVGVEVNDNGDVVFTKNHPYQIEEHILENAWPIKQPEPTHDELKTAEEALYETPEDYWDSIAGEDVRAGDIVRYVGTTPDLTNKIGRVIHIDPDECCIVEFLDVTNGYGPTHNFVDVPASNLLVIASTTPAY